jgi:hypothetical protein
LAAVGTSILIITLVTFAQLYAWETGPVTDLAVFLLCGEVVDYKVKLDPASFPELPTFNG